MNCLLTLSIGDVALLDRLAKSIDYPIQNKIVINNWHKGHLKSWQEKNSDWQVV